MPEKVKTNGEPPTQEPSKPISIRRRDISMPAVDRFVQAKSMIEYEAQGVNDSKKQELLNNLRSLIEPAFRDNPITRVIITREFAASVRQFMPVESGEEYDPAHEYGTAIAKTIPVIRGDHIGFVIIFDARIFADLSAATAVDREAKVIHELVHVKNGLLQFANIGKGAFVRTGTKRAMLMANSWAIWEEYDAERYVAERLVTAYKSINPAVKVKFNLTLGFADDVVKMLHDFHGFLLGNIRKFRDWQIDATAITHSMTSKVAGILILLSYVYALRSISDDVNTRISEIESNVNYLRFFSGNWTTIVDCLERFYEDRNAYRSDILQKMAEAYGRIILTCGLELRDAEAGFSVIVNDVDE
jgi:hypothetical protein